ncbi:hypothetical protein BKA61DRAFT_94367 [Leptodontidium sp. MPI-SDFR-AT-0119]|nr:hypothetical protein BKA61DRAFT_94367 [Leptodontidium sp. MPI-SDFR-AT-0119]
MVVLPLRLPLTSPLVPIAGCLTTADFGNGRRCQGCQDSSSLVSPIGSGTPPPAGDHAKMPQMLLKPEDGSGPSASAPQELREKESEHLQTQTQDHNHNHDLDQTSVVPAITVPSLILTALFIRQAYDPSTFLRTLELFCQQHCMNATTFYCDLIDWVFGHGHLIMLILQSTATFSAFAWCVTLDAS